MCGLPQILFGVHRRFSTEIMPGPNFVECVFFVDPLPAKIVYWRVVFAAGAFFFVCLFGLLCDNN